MDNGEEQCEGQQFIADGNLLQLLQGQAWKAPKVFLGPL